MNQLATGIIRRLAPQTNGHHTATPQAEIGCLGRLVRRLIGPLDNADRALREVKERNEANAKLGFLTDDGDLI